MIRSLRPLELALAGIAAILLLLIGAVFSGLAHSPDWLPAQAPRESSAVAEQASTAQNVELQSLANVWQQPLFSTDRSPYIALHKSQQAASLNGLSLTGVIINGDLQVAFIKQKSGPPLKVRRGEKLPNGWTLQQLTPVQADFILEGRSESLNLSAPRLPPPSTTPPVSLPHEPAP